MENLEIIEMNKKEIEQDYGILKNEYNQNAKYLILDESNRLEKDAKNMDDVNEWFEEFIYYNNGDNERNFFNSMVMKFIGNNFDDFVALIVQEYQLTIVEIVEEGE